jgi:WD40 repeat protein
MVATTHERIVRVWDTETGALIAELGGHRQRLGFVLWQPDGGLIATGTQSSMITESLDNTIRIWDAQAFSDTPAFTYTHQGRVQGMAWSRDGIRLASVDADGIVKVWDATSCRVTLEFDIHDAIWVADPYPLNIEWSYANDYFASRFHYLARRWWRHVWDAQTGEGVDGGGGNRRRLRLDT